VLNSEQVVWKLSSSNLRAEFLSQKTKMEKFLNSFLNCCFIGLQTKARGNSIRPRKKTSTLSHPQFSHTHTCLQCGIVSVCVCECACVRVREWERSSNNLLGSRVSTWEFFSRLYLSHVLSFFLLSLTLLFPISSHNFDILWLVFYKRASSASFLSCVKINF